MTPADRDIARSRAQAIVDGAPCTDVEEVFARYILRYVPAGDVAPPIGFIVQPVAATDDKPASVVTVTPKGRFYPLDVEMARQMGAAYHAAADAAEEK